MISTNRAYIRETIYITMYKLYLKYNFMICFLCLKLTTLNKHIYLLLNERNLIQIIEITKTWQHQRPRGPFVFVWSSLLLSLLDFIRFSMVNRLEFLFLHVEESIVCSCKCVVGDGFLLTRGKAWFWNKKEITY